MPRQPAPQRPASRRNETRRSRLRRSSIAATSAALVLLTTAGLAAAQARPAPAPSAQATQSAKAEALFDDGSRLMSAGQTAQACDAFEASNRIESRAGTLISLGQCREQNGQLASAVDAYQRALVRVKDPRKRQFASSRITELRVRLSYLTVAIADAVDGLVIARGDVELPPVEWNQPVPVDGGDYEITARAPERSPWHTTVHVAATGAKVRVDIPALASAHPAAPEPPVRDPQPTVTAQASRAWLTTPRIVALGLAGGSVIGVVVGAALGASANGKEHDAFALCPDPAMSCDHADRANGLISSSHRRATEANVAFGLAGAAAATAVALWFVGAPDTSSEERAARVSVAPQLAPGRSSLVVRGTF